MDKGKRIATPSAQTKKLGKQRPVRNPAQNQDREAPRFHREAGGGFRPSMPLKKRGDLRTGKVSIAGRVDLHGCSGEVAADIVRRRVAQAAAGGLRCILIIHGRGRHSGGTSVLRDVVIETLTRLPTASYVQGFYPAQPRDGGVGAMYVLVSGAKSNRAKRP